MKEELLEVLFMLVAFVAFASGFLYIYFRWRVPASKEDPTQKKLL